MNKIDKLQTVGSSRSLPFKLQANSNPNEKNETSSSQIVTDPNNRQANSDANQTGSQKQQISQQQTKNTEANSNSRSNGQKKDLHLKIDTRSKNDGSSQRGLYSQSTSSNAENNNEKFNDSESQFGTQAKTTNLTTAKEQSLDYKESNDNQTTNGTSFKTFSFVSVVMEPNKKNPRSMKTRDRNKPIIDQSIIDKQIQFMNRLLENQRQNQFQLPIEFDEMRDVKYNDSKFEKNKSAKEENRRVIMRGNLGFCYLDMSLVNLCGIPSLWLDQREYLKANAKITVNQKKHHKEPLIKPYQKNLLKKQFKIYQFLRFHKIFENDKYFGKNISMMFNQGCQNIIVDYWEFHTENLKDAGKYHQHQMKLIQKRQESLKEKFYQSNKEKQHALYILQGSTDQIVVDIPRISEPDPAFFKLINSEAKILKQILYSQNIQQTDQNNWNLLWTSVTLQQKPQIYEQLLEHQKINHFMNSVELTRKDRFADNIFNMKQKFGSNHFEFIPETYQFPEEFPIFQQRFNQIKSKMKKGEYSHGSDEGKKEDNLWIYKPSQSSQGKGILIIQELSDLQKDLDKGVISKYISNPLLVNHHKFDLRIYVLLTSVDPLRIYIYNEGLVRFASSPYDSSKHQIKNLYSHLTNYSINKKSDSFSQNKSLEERDHGNKWSMSDLQTHFEKLGINMQPVWERIYDAIIKSLISVEHHLLAGCKKIQHSNRPQNCFELFGFDIILDSNFKPYILEVNFSPSLSADSPLDYHIKSNLLVDTLNIVGLKKVYKRRTISQKNPVIQKLRQNLGANNGIAGYLQMIQAHFKQKENYRQNQNLKIDFNSFSQFLAQGNVEQYFLERLSRISAKHRELVYETLDELQRNKNLNYTCIYPAAGCYQYDRFFEGGGRVTNQLVHRYLFTKNDLFNLTKQLSDYQKQYLQNKYGEDYNSKSEQEESQNTSSNQESDKEQDNQQQESINVSPVPKSSKLQPEPPTILEKNELSESGSNDDSPQNKNQDVQELITPIKIEPSTPQVERSLNNKQSESNINDTKEDESNTSVKESTQEVNLKPSKILSVDTQSPSKFTNNSYEPEIQMIKTQILKNEDQTSDLKINELNKKSSSTQGEDKVVQRKTESQPASRMDSKTSNPSPIRKQRETIDQTQSMKTSQTKITLQNIPEKKPAQAAKNEDLPPKPKAEQLPPKPEQNSKQKQKSSSKIQESHTLQSSQVKSINIEKEEKKQSQTNVQQLKPVKQPSINSLKEIAKETVPEPEKQTVPEAVVNVNLTMSDTNPDTMMTIEKAKEITQLTEVKEEVELKSPTQAVEESIKQEQAKETEKLTEEDSKDDKPVEKKKQKMIITGDDILIEYVNRIIKHMESICIVFHKKYNQKVERVDDILPMQLKTTLDKFSMHQIWSTRLNTQQKQAALNLKIKIRHKEMVDRRTKILTTMLKKNNNKISQQEIQDELQTQDTNREKIISRIQSQKIEKMVKQSNVENQIDIVSILVEGQYNLPVFLQVAGGKTVINGTLTSLKIFEKILKSEKVQNLQNNYLLMEQEKKLLMQQQSPQKIKNNVEFLTESKPTRENSKLVVSSILMNNSNTQIAYRHPQLQSANKAEKYHLPMIIGGANQPIPPHIIVQDKQNLNQTVSNLLPDAQRRRMTNSGSASGYKNSQVKSTGASQNDTSQTYNNSMIHTMVGINNSYIQNGSQKMDESKDNLKYHSISEGPKPKVSRQIMAGVHQKNTQSIICSTNNQNYQCDVAEYHIQQSFDKRQRSYRNDNQILSMTYNKMNPDQMINLQKELREKMRAQNIGNGLQRINQTNFQNIQDQDLNLNSVKNGVENNFANKNHQVIQTFSPQSNSGQNPKVSNSAISINKAGEHLINNNGQFVEFNRSHQGEGSFYKKIQTIKKVDNYEQPLQIQGPMGTLTSVKGINCQSPLEHPGSLITVQNTKDGKRGSSHSYHAGGGTRASTYKGTPGMQNNPTQVNQASGTRTEI